MFHPTTVDATTPRAVRTFISQVMDVYLADIGSLALHAQSAPGRDSRSSTRPSGFAPLPPSTPRLTRARVGQASW